MNFGLNYCSISFIPNQTEQYVYGLLLRILHISSASTSSIPKLRDNCYGISNKLDVSAQLESLGCRGTEQGRASSLIDITQTKLL